MRDTQAAQSDRHGACRIGGAQTELLGEAAAGGDVGEHLARAPEQHALGGAGDRRPRAAVGRQPHLGELGPDRHGRTAGIRPGDGSGGGGEVEGQAGGGIPAGQQQ